MKQLRISPKEAGTTIRFGKLPIFTRSLTHWSDMDNVVQLKVEGRYYAIELRPSPLEEALEKMRTAGMFSSASVEIPQDDEIAKECKADVEEAETPRPTPAKSPFQTHYQIGRERFQQLKELEKSGKLAECRNRLDICRAMGFEAKRGTTGYNWISIQIRKGFLDEELISYEGLNSGKYKYSLTGEEPNYTGNKKIREKARPKIKAKDLEELGFTSLPHESEPSSSFQERFKKPFERGGLKLYEWLSACDYLIYKLFIYGNGQVSMGKAVSFDEIRDVFAQLPHVEISKGKEAPGKFAGRLANIVIVQLLRKGVIEKSDPDVSNKDNIFSLTVMKGGQYARKVYTTVSNGKYGKNTRRERILAD